MPEAFVISKENKVLLENEAFLNLRKWKDISEILERTSKSFDGDSKSWMEVN